MKIYKLKIVVTTLLLSLTAQSWAFDSGSTGADGAFAPTANTSVSIPANGILNYTTFNIPSGVTVKFTRNTANTPVFILVQGDAVIDGSIDVSGLDANIVGAPPPGGFAGGLPGLSAGETGQGPGGGRGALNSSDAGNGGSYSSFGSNGTSNGSAAGQVYGSSTLQPLLGGSGGGGTVITNLDTGSRGGGGGGAILVAVSGTLTLNGQILANGGAGAPTNGSANAHGSGGGSGGAVRLIATVLAGSGSVNVTGGTGGTAGSGNGGNGGNGRSRLEAEQFNFTGSVTPNIVVTSAPQPIFPANLPNVRITSVAGVTVPANPTGDSDVVLPTSVSNPVIIELAATDVPLNSTIDVTLTPSTGSATTVTSTALTGTVADSTATANVSLPQGASTLVATVTFNVSGSTASLYTPYTNGELVAKVELRSTFGAGSEMLLTTESGNVYRVKS